MKKTKRASILASSLMMATLCGVNVFAVGSNYGIVYSGGQDLGESNVTINSGLIEKLTPLIKKGESAITSTPNQSSKWQRAYISGNRVDTCYNYYYFTVSEDHPITASDGLGFTVTSDQYKADVTITAVNAENLDGATTAVGIVPEHSFVYGGWEVKEAGCETPREGLTKISAQNSDNKIFVDMNIKLYRKGENTVLKSNQLYFGITDIDVAQSFKILNSGNELSKNNMFAKNAADLQPDPAESTLKNKYVADGNYIYSEYEKGGNPYTINSPELSNIYVKLNESTQQEGLNVVFGFASAAGSGLEYYAEQYVVTYDSDDYGRITGIANEDVIAGEKPSGTTQQPNEGYADKRWTADVDVTLTNGTVIRHGETLTAAQIKQVVVNQNITFMVYHERQYKVTYVSDENGEITGIENENVAAGNNPAGTEQKPNEGYVDKKWTADVDVTLEDGTVIKAGETLTAAQIKQVVVDQDITFKVYHEPGTPATPDTGSTTKNADVAKIAALPVIALLGIALAIRALPRFTHKKVNFKK